MVDGEAFFQLVRNLVKAPGFYSAFGGEGIAMHRIGAKQNREFVFPDGMDEYGQALSAFDLHRNDESG